MLLFGLLLIITISLIFLFNYDGNLQGLHTEGRYIKNQNGEIVILRGVAIIELDSKESFGVSKYWGQKNGDFEMSYGFLPNSFDLLTKYGVNCIRLSINWYAWMGIDHPSNPINPDQADRYKKSVDTFIQQLNKRGIYCFIDFHVFNGYQSPENWQYFIDNQLHLYWRFWQEIAERYRNRPGMMGCEIMNEPRGYYNNYPYKGFWWDFALETSKKIHEVNPRLLIFVASTDNTVNGTKLGFPADTGYKVIGDQFVTEPLPEPNIVYVFHQGFPMEAPEWNVYNSYVSGNLSQARRLYEEWLYKIAFRALDSNLPIMNSEFNIKNYDYRTAEELPYPYLIVARDLFELMNQDGCSWTWWSWKGSVGYPWDYSPDSNQLVYMGKADTQVWNKLSKIGEIWREYLNK